MTLRILVHFGALPSLALSLSLNSSRDLMLLLLLLVLQRACWTT
jgi:hypothetical protein